MQFDGFLDPNKNIIDIVLMFIFNMLTTLLD
jgi:hypothetical protein